MLALLPGMTNDPDVWLEPLRPAALSTLTFWMDIR